jgi:V/A-type H+-transporting ATPase subunit E
MADAAKIPSGVHELIVTLREEGVKAGQQEAERLLRQAQGQADQIVAQAKGEAQEIRRQMREEIEKERTAAQEAIKMAFRDTELRLESEITAVFAAHVKRLVSMQLQDRDFLRQLILSIVGRVASGVRADQPVEVLLPDQLFVTDDRGARLTDEGKKRLRHFILGISSEMLREGVEMRPAGNDDAGMRIRLVGKDLEIDLSAKAMSELLLKYLIPRFREILKGLE